MWVVNNADKYWLAIAATAAVMVVVGKRDAQARLVRQAKEHAQGYMLG